MEELPSTIEEIKAKIATLERQALIDKLKIMEKNSPAADNIIPPPPPFIINSPPEVKEANKKEELLNQMVTKRTAAIEVLKELKASQTQAIISMIAALLIYGVTNIYGLAGGVAALIALIPAGIRLFNVKKDAEYLRKTYVIK